MQLAATLFIVFSTSVEVFLSRGAAQRYLQGLLHVRGGVSPSRALVASICVSSPRPWRCFSKRPSMPRRSAVFSTSVEVFLTSKSSVCSLIGLLHVRGGVSPGALDKKRVNGLLHVRGGVSALSDSDIARMQSSPRPWRCFLKVICGRCRQNVFSTSVEVFLEIREAALRPRRLLHVRGGVSAAKGLYEMDYLSLLHVRGGVSINFSFINGHPSSSPRPWRCFSFTPILSCLQAVFSTSVEVFLQAKAQTDAG